MFKLVAQYLAAGKIRFENGFVVFADQRMLFLPDNVLSEIQKSLQKKFGVQEGNKLAYSLFRDGGKNISNAIREKENLKGAEIVKWIAEVASSAGWGTISMVDFNVETKKTIFSVINSPFPQFFKERKPCCYMTKGLIAGTLTTVFKDEIDGVELECVGDGHKKCLMIFQPRKEWVKVKTPELKKAAKEQLNGLLK